VEGMDRPRLSERSALSLVSGPDSRPSLTVVVPCLNEEQTIGSQLTALASQEWTRPWEVVVADNGSEDASVAVVEGYRDRLPGLRVVDAAEKRGQAHALNVGVRAAHAEAVAFCDADDEVAPGWVAAMGDALLEHELVGCAAEVTKLNEPWVRDVRVLEPDGPSKLWFPPYLPFAGSGGLGVHRRIHELSGGFDESMPVLFDVDFCVRAQMLGAEFVHVPHALIHYRFRHRWREIFAQARKYSIYGARLQRTLKPAEARFPGVAKWALTGWRPVLRSVARAGRRDARARLAWQLGWLVGRLQGSARYRVLAV
jgi:glycosyltransferase involved in cell wall biosynthesis